MCMLYLSSRHTVGCHMDFLCRQCAGKTSVDVSWGNDFHKGEGNQILQGVLEGQKLSNQQVYLISY